MTLDLVIHGLPSCNSAAAVHWRKRHAERQAWKSHVTGAVLAKLGRFPSKPLERARVTLTRCSSQEPDADNLASSFKFVLDGLKLAGVIEDDKPSCIGTPEFRWEKTGPKVGCVRIRVEEVAT
ncbi:MAG: hypothetical protein RIS45_1585 [Planctomycetota bacterium]|jgi:Holliday junction resolvase RusA-like endonuclease